MAEITQDKTLKRFGLGGSGADVIAGIGAVVLTILGLVGVVPSIMLAVATMALGVALLVESGAFAAEYSRLLEVSGATRAGKYELGGGLGGEGAAGAAALVLGILAIIGIVPGVLLPSAAIVLGAGLSFGSGVHDRIREMRVGLESEYADKLTRETIAATTGAEILVGISAVVLGILALVGFAPLTLTLVAMLAVGASVLLSGAAIGGRVMSVLR